MGHSGGTRLDRSMQFVSLLALAPMPPAYGGYAPAPAYGGYAPQPPPYYQPAPAYHHAVHHGYEHPKHNCSVLDVVEAAEVCTPALETVCNPVELARKSIKDVEQCYTVVRTVCTESFEKMCETQMVTVCQPAPHGYGYGHSYGHNYCKEVGQETCYNVPIVTVVEPPVDVIYPEPIKTCVNKPISLPRISCEDLSEEKCITVPEVEDVTETFE